MPRQSASPVPQMFSWNRRQVTGNQVEQAIKLAQHLRLEVPVHRCPTRGSLYKEAMLCQK